MDTSKYHVHVHYAADADAEKAALDKCTEIIVKALQEGRLQLPKQAEEQKVTA